MTQWSRCCHEGSCVSGSKRERFKFRGKERKGTCPVTWPSLLHYVPSKKGPCFVWFLRTVTSERALTIRMRSWQLFCTTPWPCLCDLRKVTHSLSLYFHNKKKSIIPSRVGMWIKPPDKCKMNLARCPDCSIHILVSLVFLQGTYKNFRGAQIT